MLSTVTAKLSNCWHCLAVSILFVINIFITSCRYLKLSTIERACFKTILAMAYKSLFKKLNSSFQFVNAHWLLSELPLASIKGPGVKWPQEMKKWKFNDHKRHRFRIFHCIGFVLQWFHWDPDPQRFAELMSLRVANNDATFIRFIDIMLFAKENQILLRRLKAR